MNSTSCNEAVLEFDAYGFAILSGSGAEGGGELEDERCHVYRSALHVHTLKT